MNQEKKKINKLRKRPILAAVIAVIFIAAIGLIYKEYHEKDATVYKQIEYCGLNMKYPDGYLVEKSVLEENVKFKVSFTSPKKMEQFLDKIITVTWDKKAKSSEEVYELFLSFDGFDGMHFVRTYDSEIAGIKCHVIDYTVYGMLYGRFRFFKCGDSVVVYQTEADRPEKLEEKLFETVAKSIEIK